MFTLPSTIGWTVLYFLSWQWTMVLSSTFTEVGVCAPDLAIRTAFIGSIGYDSKRRNKQRAQWELLRRSPYMCASWSRPERLERQGGWWGNGKWTRGLSSLCFLREGQQRGPLNLCHYFSTASNPLKLTNRPDRPGWMLETQGRMKERRKRNKTWGEKVQCTARVCFLYGQSYAPAHEHLQLEA